MTLLYMDDCFLDHDTGEHPECADRLRSVAKHLNEINLIARFDRGQIRTASLDQLCRVHSADHVEDIKRLASVGGGEIGADTIMSRQSFDVGLRAAGTAIDAVGSVIRGPHKQAVCLIRPPGHHALPAQAMGFCLFNNIAIAAMQAQEVHQLDRILIVDWDVHHGNGTQDIFYESDQVYFFSAHRYPFYPGTGSDNETGTGTGLGTTFNLPLEFGISRQQYLAQFRNLLEDVAQRCRPNLLLLSAGFDAHVADPIGSLGLESEDFESLTEAVVAVANEYTDGRIVSLLEGGYNVDALAESVGVHLETLLRCAE